MDLHERFDDWLADGADGEPPRDLALHASTCDGCLRAVAVVESLHSIQVGAAELPPLRFVGGRPRPFRIARMAVGALAVILLGVGIAIGASGMLAPAPSADAPAASTAERVLAGVPTEEASPTPTPSASPTPSPTPSASPTPSPTPSATPTASPEPTAAPAQPPAPRTPAPPPPQPPTAAPPTPAPTAAPTVAPTSAPPIPSPPPPPPTPTPVPDDCEDGIDNDGDELIDILDPGCVLTGNEPDG